MNPDTFCSLFEQIVAGDWPDSGRSMLVLVQHVVTGKAQEAYSALSVAGSEVYEVVKSVIFSV